MKRAWFQRIRGGDVKPWFKGKNPCFITLWFSTFVICHPFVSSNLVNLFNDLLGGWAVMAAGGWAVITFGSGVAGLSVLCPHPTSTHDPMLSLPVLFSSRACSLCPWHFVPLHELLLTFTQGIVAVTHTQPISRPFSCCCSPTSPGRAVYSSRGLIVSLTHGKFWVFPRLLDVSFSLIWDCCFPCVLWVVVFNFVLCHYGFPIRGLSFCILGLCIVAIVLL